MIEEFLFGVLGLAIVKDTLAPFFPNVAQALKPTPLPAKDPNDLTLSSGSTQWEQEYYCPKCRSKIGHQEYMTDTCNTCGFLNGRLSLFPRRTHREIWDGKEWVNQFNYDNDPDHMEVISKGDMLLRSKPIVPQPLPVRRTRVRTNTTGAH